MEKFHRAPLINVYVFIFMLGISTCHTEEVLWMSFSLVSFFRVTLGGRKVADISKSGA